MLPLPQLLRAQLAPPQSNARLRLPRLDHVRPRPQLARKHEQACHKPRVARPPLLETPRRLRHPGVRHRHLQHHSQLRLSRQSPQRNRPPRPLPRRPDPLRH